ncbi:hypothetical protein S245_070203, partial [Arachis hypogaea]
GTNHFSGILATVVLPPSIPVVSSSPLLCPSLSHSSFFHHCANYFISQESDLGFVFYLVRTEKGQREETHLRARIVAAVPLYPSVSATLRFSLPDKRGEAKVRPARCIGTAVKSCRRNALHFHFGSFLSGSGSTPLYYAACGENAQCCQLLIAKGANLNTQNANGWTPLMVVRSWNRNWLEDILKEPPSENLEVLPSLYLSLPLMSIVKIA